MSEILKVRGAANGQKRITIPAESRIEPGDYVAVEKVSGIAVPGDD